MLEIPYNQWWKLQWFVYNTPKFCCSRSRQFGFGVVPLFENTDVIPRLWIVDTKSSPFLLSSVNAMQLGQSFQVLLHFLEVESCCHFVSFLVTVNSIDCSQLYVLATVDLSYHSLQFNEVDFQELEMLRLYFSFQSLLFDLFHPQIWFSSLYIPLRLFLSLGVTFRCDNRCENFAPKISPTVTPKLEFEPTSHWIFVLFWPTTKPTEVCCLSKNSKDWTWFYLVLCHRYVFRCDSRWEFRCKIFTPTVTPMKYLYFKKVSTGYSYESNNWVTKSNWSQLWRLDLYKYDSYWKTNCRSEITKVDYH